VVGGLAAWFLQAPDPGSPAAGAQSPAAGRTVPTPTVDATPPKRARWVPGSPRRITIPALHVAAPVLPIKAAGGTLVPPSDPQELGWWAGGARPGAARGSALVTGHTVHTGGGALDDLGTLRRGDPVVVRTDRGRIDYVVRAVRVYSKGSVAEHAQRLFSQRGPGRLVLVTCGDWNGSVYLSNVVVTAVPRHRR